MANTHSGVRALYVDQYLEGEVRDITQSECIVDVVLRAHAERFALLERLRQSEAIMNACDALEASTDAALEEYNSVHSELRAIGADRDESEVKRVLRGLGFTVADLIRPFSEFSGGWKTRVLLARGLYRNPQILMLDEPTNHLDLNAVIWFSDYLSKWKGTLIVVSHNIAFLDTICTNIIAFEHAQLREYRGNYTRYKIMAMQLAMKAETDWEALVKQTKALRKVGKKTDAAALEKKRATEGLVKPETIKRVHMRFQEIRELPSPVVTLDAASFTYASSAKPVLTGLNLRINSNARLTLVGPNGAGKTTFLNMVAGVTEPTGGDIVRHSVLRIGYYGQHAVETLPGDQTATEYLRTRFSISEADARSYLGRVGLEGATHIAQMSCLSGGQRARVVFAELQIKPCHLLILDEPTNHLDIDAVESLIEAIKEFQGAVLIVTHDSHLITSTGCQLWRCGHTFDESSCTVSEFKGEYDDYVSEIVNEGVDDDTD